MADVTDATFDAEVLQSPSLVMVDFWAPWCGPCKSMLPTMEELTKEYEGKMNIAKVNVDENGDTAGKYNVMSIPTFAMFKDGKLVKTIVGAKSKAEMKKEIDALL